MSNEQLAIGRQALKEGRYLEAVRALELFCRNSPIGSQNHFQAQMWLIKAYQGNNQLEQAITLNQQLASSGQESVQNWARQFLPSLLVAASPDLLQKLGIGPQQSPTSHPQASQEKPAPEATSTASITLKSLSEFKLFCKRNLAKELRKFEKARQQTLTSVTVLNIIFLVVVIALGWGLLAISTPNSSEPLIGSEVVGYWVFRIASAIIFIVVSAFLALFWSRLHSSFTESYGKGFRQQVIEKIVRFIDPRKTLDYTPDFTFHPKAAAYNTAMLAAIKKSLLFGNQLSQNQLTQRDCISGKMGGTDIVFAEVSLDKMSYRSDLGLGYYAGSRELDSVAKQDNYSYQDYDFGYGIDHRGEGRQLLVLVNLFLSAVLIFFRGIPYIFGKVLRGKRLGEKDLSGTSSRSSLFNGLFFVAEFNKRFTSTTLVLPDLAEKFLGQLGTSLQSLNKKRGELVKLEDPEFERFFVVYGEDQIEARYVLSTSLMAKLVKFRKQAGRDVYISLVDNKIFIAVRYEEDLFEPKLFKSMLSFAPMRLYFESLQLMMAIVSDLNLNRKIWRRS